MNTSDVEIFFAESTGSGVKVGAPVFFSLASGSVMAEPSQYLRERFVESGRSSALTTWRGAAYKLAMWWDYLAAAEIEWDLATRQDLVEFRDFFLEKKSSVTGLPYASGTVASYVSLVIDFYDFFHAKGLYSGSICDENILIKNNKNHLNRIITRSQSACSDLVPTRNEQIIVHPYSPGDFIKFSQSINSNYSNRDRLIFKIILMSGLRVSEVVNLSFAQFLGDKNEHPYTYQGVWVLGEGKKIRFVMLPNLLINEISEYIFNDRAVAVKSGGVKDISSLFVTSINSRRPGRSLSIRRIQEIHAENCLKAGLIRNSKGYGNNGDRKVFPKYRVHDLRHTYAVWSYHILKSMGDPEPWKWIQTQLGHKHMDTTMNIYLKHVSLLDEKLPMASLQEIMAW